MTNDTVISTYLSANRRIHAAITLPVPITREQLNDYLEEFAHAAFRAVNAVLEAGEIGCSATHLDAPLVVVEALERRDLKIAASSSLSTVLTPIAATSTTRHCVSVTSRPHQIGTP